MNKFDFDKIVEKIPEFKEKLLEKCGHKLAELFKKNFEEEGFFGNKWEDRKYDYKTKEWGGKILGGPDGKIGSGIKIMEHNGEMVKVGVVGEAQDWAWVHNEGTDKEPKREFMGDADPVFEALNIEIEQEIDKLFE